MRTGISLPTRYGPGIPDPQLSTRLRRHETATSTFGGNIITDRTGHPLSNGLFTPPTRTRQKRLVLSCRQYYSAPTGDRQFCLVSTQFPISVASYLDPAVSVSFVSFRSSFHFATNSLFTPPTRTTQTVLSCPCRRCEQAITLAAVLSWNTLLHSVSSASTLLIFRRLLKTHLFHRSFYSYFYL